MASGSAGVMQPLEASIFLPPHDERESGEYPIAASGDFRGSRSGVRQPFAAAGNVRLVASAQAPPAGRASFATQPGAESTACRSSRFNCAV